MTLRRDVQEVVDQANELGSIQVPLISLENVLDKNPPIPMWVWPTAVIVGCICVVVGVAGGSLP